MCVLVDLQRTLNDGLRFSVTSSRVIVTPGNDYGILLACYIVKAIDREPAEQIQSVDNNCPLKVPEGKQTVEMKSLHAFDNEFSYYIWRLFGSRSIGVMLLLDNRLPISILPRTLWMDLRTKMKLAPKPTEVEIEVGNGGKLKTYCTVRLPFKLSEYAYEHGFSICQDSSTAILGNDFIVHNQVPLFMSEG